MAIYECRIMFKANSPTPHRSPIRNPANTSLCAGYSYWTPTAQGGGSSFANGVLADHKHMRANTDTLTVVLYDVSNTVSVGTLVSGVLAFRSQYIGAANQEPFGTGSNWPFQNLQFNAPAQGAPPFPYAYVLPTQGWMVTNQGDYDFSVLFSIQVNNVTYTFFMDPEMGVDPSAGK